MLNGFEHFRRNFDRPTSGGELTNVVPGRVLDPRGRRTGLSLLEMIIATAIMLAAAVTLARLSFITRLHAQRAEDRAVAVQITDYQLQRLLLGELPLAPAERQPVLETSAEIGGDSPEPHPWDDWEYSLEAQPTALSSLYEVRLTVYRLPMGSGSFQPNAGGSGVGSGMAAEGVGDAVRSNELGTPGSTAGNAAAPSQDSASQGPDPLFEYSVMRLVHVAAFEGGEP